MIQWANVFQAVSFHFTKIPKGVTNRSILIKGYQGLPFKTEIFEPSNVTERLPCLMSMEELLAIRPPPTTKSSRVYMR